MLVHLALNLPVTAMVFWFLWGQLHTVNLDDHLETLTTKSLLQFDTIAFEIWMIMERLILIRLTAQVNSRFLGRGLHPRFCIVLSRSPVLIGDCRPWLWMFPAQKLFVFFLTVARCRLTSLQKAQRAQ